MESETTESDIFDPSDDWCEFSEITNVSRAQGAGVSMVTSMEHQFQEALQFALDNYSTPLPITPKDKQTDALRSIYKGKDTILFVPTCYGKSLCAHLMPFLLRHRRAQLSRNESDLETGMVLVISPLNIIQEDQKQKLLDCGLTADILDYHGTNAKEILAQDLDIIMGHPESFFCNEAGKRLINDANFQKRVIGIVVDECHKAEEWASKVKKDDNFRGAFGDIFKLRAFFQGVPMLAMSGTLSKKQLKVVPGLLGLNNPVMIAESPDRPNIKLSLVRKEICGTPVDVYEQVYLPLCYSLYRNPSNFPVTLLYIPMEHAANCMTHLSLLFGGDDDISTAKFAAVFSKQDKHVLNFITRDLSKDNPQLRLILCSPSLGMGYDPPAVDRVIHARPPRTISDYVQQIGRAGRSGQPAEAILYYCPTDIKKNLDGLDQEIIDYCKSGQCLRKVMLDYFAYKKGSTSPIGCMCCSICKQFCECSLCVLENVKDILALLIKKLHV